MAGKVSGNSKVQKRYARRNDRGYGSNLVYTDKGESTEKQFYVTDPHGNVVQLTDENGKIVKTYEYDSFGNEVNPDSKDDNPFRYCGEYYDKETEEIYLRARYYQSSVGRFLTRDTYTGEDDDVLSLHLYAYCGNDGVNGVDPSGHDAIWLQYSKAAVWQGHTGLLLQVKKRKWDYLYWGPVDEASYTMILSGVDVKSKKIYRKGIQIDISLRKESKEFKAMLNRNLKKFYNEEITGYTYIKGDFKESRNYAETYNEYAYNLYDNNCMQVSVKTLLKGKFKGAKAKRIEEFLGRIVKEGYVRPNKTYTDLRNWIGK